MFLLGLSVGKLSSGTGNERTRSPLLHLLRRDSKHAQHFCHNLSHHIRHRRSRRDLCIGLETYKEVFDFVEEFDERIAARSSVPSRLREKVLLRPTQRNRARTLTTRRMLIPAKTI